MVTNAVGHTRPPVTQGDSVRVTIELQDGRTLVTDGTFWEVSYERDVIEVPSPDQWSRYESGELWFRLTLRYSTATQHITPKAAE